MKRIKLFAIFLVVLAGLAGLSYALWGDSDHQEETKPVLSVVQEETKPVLYVVVTCQYSKDGTVYVDYEMNGERYEGVTVDDFFDNVDNTLAEM